MNNSPNTPDTPEEEAHFLDYLIVLAKHSRWIIYSILTVMVLTYLMLFILPNEYTATARLLPPQQNMTMSGQLMDMIGGGVKPGSMGGTGLAGLLGFKSPTDLYVGMLTGDTIADRIIEQFNLKELYKTKTTVDTRKALSKKAKIISRKDGLIIIEVTDESAQRAAGMANAFIEELDELLQRLGVQEARGRLAFLEKELAAANAHLVKAEEAVRSFSEKNSVIQIDTQTKGMLHYIAQLRAEIDAKEVQVQVLRQQATSYNYDVVRLETQVKGLKEKLQTAEKQWDQTCMGDVCLSTSKMPTLGLEYIRLYRQFKYQETLYELFTKMVEIARLDLVKDVAVVQTVDKALPPDKKSKPKRFTLTILSGLSSAFLLIIVAFLMEYWKINMQSKGFYDRWQLLKQYVNNLKS
jgi:tyrosine-protein kinase Etk/Wzc